MKLQAALNDAISHHRWFRPAIYKDGEQSFMVYKNKIVKAPNGKRACSFSIKELLGEWETLPHLYQD